MKTKFPYLRILIVVFCLFFIGLIVNFVMQQLHQQKILKQMIARLTADTRIAEVIVVKQGYDPLVKKHETTIKFLEYDTLGNPMSPKYFTFQGNIIQFQSLVVRFTDKFVMAADTLKGKSIYLFWKAFVLDGANTQEYVITPINQIPEGYRINKARNAFEEDLWKNFWDYALNSKKAISKGIKNAQIEAPGTKFLPGYLYTLKIEHDGGIRIDVSDIPAVLRGETILK